MTRSSDKRKLVRALISPYTALTSSLRAMPEFIIIGAAKCGTTSLYNYLIEHPNVKSAFQKEPNFFNKHFDRGITFYKSQFPLRSPGFITGEASPDYLFYPPAPQRIAKLIPSVKLIVLLRNPVDTAYSLYYHRLKYLRNKDSSSFEEAIEQEPERLNKELEKTINDENSYNRKDYYQLYKKYYYRSYLSRCIYINFIKRWSRLFPKEQLLILKSEDLYHNSANTYEQVLSFLNLSRCNLRKYDNHHLNQYPKMNTATRNYLIDYFKPYNKMLYEYLGRDFKWNK